MLKSLYHLTHILDYVVFVVLNHDQDIIQDAPIYMFVNIVLQGYKIKIIAHFVIVLINFQE